ncbi:hypothetical protein C8A03DRAFT_37964 [Achaetomium macrosporum]|uniref:BTB domain-containing protein n=1 Tax=Achaetomium macrosporum TaxID=79813 RepID=A0AAN7HAW7_9PEZI|nr:hypothetical protein C8A03DRAFT_37964 [Achaetomium macrosporum]
MSEELYTQNQRRTTELAAGNARPSSAGADYRAPEHDAIQELRTTAIYSPFGKLLNSDKLSNMTTRCGGREFKAHRAIVCTQSSFSGTALTGRPFGKGILDLPDDDPDVLGRFLQFLSTGHYENATHSAIFPYVHVAATADGQTDGATPSPLLTRAERTATSTDRISDGTGDGHGDAGSDAENRSYQSNSERSSPARSEPEEPEEEYNNFDKETDVHRYDEDGDSAFSKRYRELRDGASDKDSTAAGTQLFYELRTQHNLYLRLWLYRVAGKFGVLPLRLLGTDRFLRAAELLWRSSEGFSAVINGASW